MKKKEEKKVRIFLTSKGVMSSKNSDFFCQCMLIHTCPHLVRKKSEYVYPLPPLSEKIWNWPTPPPPVVRKKSKSVLPPPLVADIICEQPLSFDLKPCSVNKAGFSSLTDIAADSMITVTSTRTPLPQTSLTKVDLDLTDYRNFFLQGGQYKSLL